MVVILLVLLGCGGRATRLSVYDGDGDGFVGGSDCDTGDPEVFPGSEREQSAGPNGLDDDCDGDVDESFDADCDHHLVEPYGRDCDDGDAQVNPDRAEIARDGLDNNCDGIGYSWPVEISLEEVLDPEGELSDAAAQDLGDLLAEPDDLERVGGLGDLDGDGLADLYLSTRSRPDASATVYLALGVSAVAVPISSCDGADADTSAGLETEAPPVAGAALEVSAAATWLPQVSAGVFARGGCRLPLLLGELDGVAAINAVKVDDRVCVLPEWSELQPATSEAWQAVGDLGGDGADEIVIGAAGSEGDPWQVAWLLAGDEGGDTTPRALVSAEIPGDRREIAPAGDVDGDRLGDLLIGLPGADTVLLLLGDDALDDSAGDADPVLLDDAAGVRFTADAGWQLGAAVAGASDLDGDGLDDVALGAPNAVNGWGEVVGAAFVFSGLGVGASGGDDTAGETGPRVERDTDQGIGWWGLGPWAQAGASVALPGDCSGDGQEDLAVGSQAGDDSELDEVGVAWLVFDPVGELGPGGARALAPAADVTAFLGAAGETWTVAAVGDVDAPEPEPGADRTSGAELALFSPTAARALLFWGGGY